MIRPRLVRYAKKKSGGYARIGGRRIRLLGKPIAKAVRRIAKRAVASATEVKHSGLQVVNAGFNSTISGANECYNVLPPIAEGTAGNERSGDRVRPKYLVVKGHLMYDTEVAGAGSYIPPSTVRLLVLTQNNIKCANDLSRVDTNRLLKDNVGTDAGRAYTATMFDNLAPINKDLFKVIADKKIKMKAIIAKELGNNNTVTWADTNRTYSFSIKIKCPAQLKFDDDNGNYANNFAPFLCMGSVLDDNSAPWTASTPYRLTALSELYFTDA